jgi:DNA-binding CsgD family transcriptional regulator
MDRATTMRTGNGATVSTPSHTGVGVPPQRAQAPRMPAQRTLAEVNADTDVNATIGSPPSTTSRPATVLVADPVATSRQSLSSDLMTSGLATVIEVDTRAAVQEIVAGAEGGDLALVSMEFGDGAIGLIQGLRETSWQRVIALAPPAVGIEHIVAVVQAGACGILRGHPSTAPLEIGRVVKELSEREIEVLTLVADGRSNKWIAGKLSLSPLTVKSHLARISRKLGTGDRSHLVAIALRHGVIS